MEKLYVVYIATHIKTGRVYIGMTGDYKARIRQYRYEYNNKLQNVNGLSKALQEYGLDEFIIEPVIRTKDLDFASKSELIFIASYDSINPKYGFNSKTDLNSGVNKSHGRTQSNEEKKQRSQAVILKDTDGKFYKFDSAKLVADYLNLERTHITRGIRYGYKVRGCYVTYYDDEKIETVIKSLVVTDHEGNNSYPVRKKGYIEFCKEVLNGSVEVIPKREY